MGRTKAKTYSQPDDHTCGPASLKTALEILGKQHYSLTTLIKLCKTTKNGTSVNYLIPAANQLGLSVLAVQWSTLRHLQSALKHNSGSPRAVIVDYLYDLKPNQTPVEDSGHYAAVASFSARNSRLILFDSASGGKKSYSWKKFLNRWFDYDYRRTWYLRKKGYRLSKKWHNRLMLVLARQTKHLPRFRNPYTRVYPA